MNSAPSPYIAFVSLARFDQAIHDKQIMLKKISHEVDIRTQELQKIEEHTKNIQQNYHDIRKLIDEKELELRILKDQEKEIKRKLDTVASVKEYNSLTHELEEIIKKQETLEDSVIELLNTADESHITSIQVVESAKKAEKEFNSFLADVRQKKDLLMQEIEHLTVERKNIRILMNAELLEKYEQMREKVVNPAAVVVDNTCSACGYYVSTQDLAAIRRHKIIECKDCYRLLYENV